MFTGPRDQQFAAFLRSFILSDPAFQTALNGAIIGGLDSVLTTQGDTIRRGASGSERLALGAANSLLSSDGTDLKYQTLTALLDAAIGNTKGTIIKRGDSAWEKLDPADGYLNCASDVVSWSAVSAPPKWQQVSGSPFTITTDLIVTGLANYQALIIELVGVSMASSGLAGLRVSTDNGSTFLSSSGDYYNGVNGGGKTSLTEIPALISAATSNVNGAFKIDSFSLSAPKPVNTSFATNYHIATATACNAIKIFGTVGALNGGTIYVSGLPGS